MRVRSVVRAGMPARSDVRFFNGRAARLAAVALLFLLPVQYAAAIQWGEPWDVHVEGQRFSVETFSSRMPPDAVARELARSNGAYQRYLVGDGRILLSGLAQGQHWLAEIQGRTEGSQGYVSALYFDAARVNASSLAASSRIVGETAAGRRLASESGAFMRLFEFESSVRVGLVALPAGASEASDGASMKADAAADTHFIAVETEPGLAVTISMLEH